MTLKIKPDDLQLLKDITVAYDTEERRQLYREGKYPRAEFTKNVNKRYRWDLLFASGGRFHNGNFLSQLYTYLNDSHIDSALKSLVKDF